MNERLAKIYSFTTGHCYEKVKLETKEMRKAIKEELGLSPVEENVIVLYDGEKDDKTHEFWKVLKIHLFKTYRVLYQMDLFLIKFRTKE